MSSKRLFIVGKGSLAKEILDIGVGNFTLSKEGVFQDCIEESDLASWKWSVYDSFVVAIADPETRKRISNTITTNGCTLFAMLHKDSHVSKSTSIGTGSIVLPKAYISCESTIQKGVIINSGAHIGHDVFVGAFSTISSLVNLCGNVHVGEESFLGAACVVSPNVKIERKSYLCAGAVVMKDAGGKLIGNPAKAI